MTTPRFGRAVRVEFLGAEIDPVTDLRVNFKVSGYLFDAAWQCRLSIWNLKESTRKKITRAIPISSIRSAPVLVEPILRVKLYAGYGTELGFLFSGDVYSAIAERDGPDWITTIELRPQYAKFFVNEINYSSGKETSGKQILSEILKPLNVTINYTKKAAEILDKEIVVDFSDSGTPFNVAKRFLDNKYKLDFLLENDGAGLVYDPSEARDVDVVSNEDNTFSAENGVVGTPRVTESGVELTCLLRPGIKMMDKFFVESKSVSDTLQNSSYKAEYFALYINHTGDTHGDDWYTDIDGAYKFLIE